MIVNKRQFKPMELLCKTIVTLSLILSFLSLTSAFKVKISQDEPELGSIYNNYRELCHDRSYFYLKSAGLLNESDIKLVGYLKEDSKNSSGHYETAKFVFNSSNFVRKYINIRWYAPATDKTSLHAYDDPKELDLASGPQVNQQKCGLLLDYMIYMAGKHYKSMTDTTEHSIFNIIQSYGAPYFGINEGKNIFPGDYRLCVTSKLNVMKNDLYQVDKEEAERFFATNHNEDDEHLSLFREISDSIKRKIGLLVRLERDPFGLIKRNGDELSLQPTRYCLAGLRWPSWPNSSYHKRNMVFRTGICLPHTCDSKSLKLYHDKMVSLIELQVTDRSKGFYINDLYCLPDEESPLRNVLNYTSSRLYIYFNIIWFTFIMMATLLSKYLSPSSSSPSSAAAANNEKETIEKRLKHVWTYLKCWDLNENLNNFWMKDRDTIKENTTIKSCVKQGNRIYLKPLEGIKVLSAICVNLVHTIILGLGIAENGAIVDYLMSKTIIVSLTTICEASVDNFFVMTGLITTLALIRRPKLTLMRPSFWIQFFIYRYIRIIPMYLLLHWSLQSFSRFLGSGPNWDYGTSYTAYGKVCQNDSLWGILIPTANLKSPTAHCNPVGWYLANDIQFSLLTPIFIILFLKKPLVAHLTILSASFIIMANHVQYYLNRPEPRHGLEFSALTIARVLNEPSNGYTYPQYRCASYLIGLSAGHLLHSYETGSTIGSGLKWHPSGGCFVLGCKLLFWFVFGALCLIPHLTVLLLPLHNESTMKFFGAIFAGTLHGVTSFAAAAFMLLVCTGHFKGLAELLSKSFLQPIANCSLSTLVVHVPLIFYQIHSLNVMPEISVYFLLTSTLIWFIESLIISAIVHVVYELPMRRLMIKLIYLILSYGKRN